MSVILSRCSELIAIRLCAIQEMHFKVRRGSVAGYTTDETLEFSPEEYAYDDKDIDNIRVIL